AQPPVRPPEPPVDPPPLSALDRRPVSQAPERPIIQVAVRRAERPIDRLVRHLQNAWGGQSEVGDALQDFSDDSVDPALRTALEEHRRLTQRQKDELEARLRALGSEPSGGKGMLQRFVGWVWESWQREPDDCDRSIQNLLKAIAASEF